MSRLRPLSGDLLVLRDVLWVGVRADWRTLIKTQPAHYWDMSNFYNSGGGVWKVRDLVDTSGASDLTVVGGDNTDFVAV